MKMKDEALKYVQQVLEDIIANGTLSSPPYAAPIAHPLATIASVEEARDRVVTALAAPNEPPETPNHAPLKPEGAPLLERAEWLRRWLQWSDHPGCYYQANIVHALIEALKADGFEIRTQHAMAVAQIDVDGHVVSAFLDGKARIYGNVGDKPGTTVSITYPGRSETPETESAEPLIALGPDGEVRVLPHMQHPAPVDAEVAPLADPGPTLKDRIDDIAAESEALGERIRSGLDEAIAAPGVKVEHTETTRVVSTDPGSISEFSITDPSGAFSFRTTVDGLTIREVLADKIAGFGGADRQPTAPSGGLNNYYLARVEHPQRPEQPPYQAEFEDIASALQFTPDEFNAGKAIWRRAAARLGNGKPGSSAQYDAEKVVHSGQRMVRAAKLGKAQ